MIDLSSGSLSMHTFIKLPTTRPRTAKKMVNKSSTYAHCDLHFSFCQGSHDYITRGNGTNCLLTVMLEGIKVVVRNNR